MVKKPKKFFKKQSTEKEGKAKEVKPTKQGKTITKKGKQKLEPKELPVKKEFPRISRFIPELPLISLERLPIPSFKLYAGKIKRYSQIKLLLASALLVFAILLSGFVALSFHNVYTSWSQEMRKRQHLYAEMQLWSNIAKTYPTYRDAYFKGALIAYELGDSKKLQYFLDKLHLLDPNFPLTAPLKKLDTVQQLGEK